MTVMRLSFTAAYMGCAVIGLQLVHYLSFLGNPESYREFSWLELNRIAVALVQGLIGAMIMALPAAAILYFRCLRGWIAFSTPLYPALLAFGFWAAIRVGDPLGYATIMVFYVLPFCVAYTLILLIAGWRLRARSMKRSMRQGT